MCAPPAASRLLALLSIALLAACSTPIAPAGRASPAATPSCRQPAHQGEDELLRSLPGASYGCAEELADALSAAATKRTVTLLLAMSRPPAHSLARRNALRALGRLAGQPPRSAAARLVRETHAAEVRAALLEALRQDRSVDVLQEAIWLLDTFLFPTAEAQPLLEAIALRASFANSADPAATPQLRARAMNAVSRLLLTRPAPVSETDLAFTLRSLASDEPGVRARAALILERWQRRGMASSSQALAVIALTEAHARAASEPLVPPTMPESGTAGEGLRFDPLLSGRPEIPAPPLAARAAVARALDAFVPGGRYEKLRAAYEALALPSQYQHGNLALRADLPAESLPPLIETLGRARGEFFALLGPAFAAPLPEGRDHTLTAYIFRDAAAYQAYMHAFVGFGADVYGVYVERQPGGGLPPRLYTYAGRATGAATLEETLAHEYAHSLAGHHLFPGAWHDPGYHAEPKGWADEGLAELIAARATGQTAAPETLCAAGLWSLAELLARRDGYDRYGAFRYDEAHALARYLLLERPESGRAIYAAYREGRYRQGELARLAGSASLAEVEAGWRASVERWCAETGR
jgi:hypothetical protein